MRVTTLAAAWLLCLATILPAAAALPWTCAADTCAAASASPGCALGGSSAYIVVVDSSLVGHQSASAIYACFDLEVGEWHIVGRFISVQAGSDGTPAGHARAGFVWVSGEIVGVGGVCDMSVSQETRFTPASSRSFGCPLGGPPALP